jgi:diguanylate cyclase (GGDEF)-like protein
MLGFVLALLMSLDCFAQSSAEVTALLEHADSIKSSNHDEFTNILQSLEQRSQSLTPDQQVYVRYLRGWQAAYVGDYEEAITTLKPLLRATPDVTLRFRARATVANVLLIARRYEEAFSELSELVSQLDLVSDKAARDQGLAVAAFLYGEVGQYDLSLAYADKLIEENWNGRGACRGGQIKVQALYDSTRTQTRPASLDEEIRKGIEACAASGELMFANAIRAYEARLLMERGQLSQAMDLLKRHYDEVAQSQYRRLISQFDVLLADLHWRMQDADLARKFALRAVENAVPNEFTEPLINAYQLLYTIDKELGDRKSALEFHEKYMAADKGYLDGVSTRQLAYERVRHEVAANKLEIESLQLQRKLDAKAIENVRLYIALLIVILGFIAFWAYKTKRSQLHFMNLARRDGLTGIFNRPHFMELAEGTLENCRKLKQDVALILCDLDHFKLINDRFGHAEGDSVLKRMVAISQSHLRAADIFARVGGEEFCIMLPACGLADARERAEQLRQAIAAANETSRATLSASMGVTATAVSGYELHQLLAHADTALYQAKRSGRNCVVVYDKDSVVKLLRPGALSTAP